MSSRTRLSWLAVPLGLVLMLAGCGGSTEARDEAKGESSGFLSGLFNSGQPVTVPQGSTLAVTLDHALATDKNRPGDSFEGTVAQAVTVDGRTVIPRGASVRGRVVEARESGRLKTVARLSLSLEEVEVDGKTYALAAGPLTLTGNSHKNRNIGFIGGGAAGGAIIGAIAGGGKGAAIGSAAGAGAGTAAAAATGKQEIRLAPESRLSFRLAEPLTIRVKG
jgi:hypothetical protein